MSAPAELLPYLHLSRGAPSASAGKRGRVRMIFELDGAGRSILRHLERRTPIIVQQELYFDREMSSMPCVYLLSSGGPNVEGDRYEHHITLRRGAFAHISTGAATKLAEMHSDYSSLRQLIELESGSYLEYLPEPTIPCRHARYVSHVRMILHHTATLFHSEILVSGRRHFCAGEHFDFDILSLTSSAARDDGEELFAERMIIEPSRHSPTQLATMSRWEVLGNCLLLAPESTFEAIYERVHPRIDTERDLAIGVTRLPSRCGLIFRVLGNSTTTVKSTIRDLCSMVRREVKGRPLPEEFVWR